MNSVQHFEIPADDLQRAGEFYSKVFGWSTNQFAEQTVMVGTTKSDENGMPKNPGAINGDISLRDETFKHPVVVITVDSIDDHFSKIEANGGKKLSDKVEVPNMGHFAYFEDSEGNTIGIWENL